MLTRTPHKTHYLMVLSMAYGHAWKYLLMKIVLVEPRRWFSVLLLCTNYLIKLCPIRYWFNSWGAARFDLDEQSSSESMRHVKCSPSSALSFFLLLCSSSHVQVAIDNVAFSLEETAFKITSFFLAYLLAVLHLGLNQVKAQGFMAPIGWFVPANPPWLTR